MGRRNEPQDHTPNGSSAVPEASPLPVDPTSSASQSSSRSPSPSSTGSPTLLGANLAPASQSLHEEHEDIFHDALDNLFEVAEPYSHEPTQPTLTNQGVSNYPTPDGTTVETSTAPSSPFESPNRSLHAPSRGAAVIPAAPDAPVVAPRLADHLERESASQAPAVGGVSRRSIKKAVVAGTNHARSVWPRPLRYANRDATCMAQSLENHGFSNNIILLTDEPGQEDHHPTYLRLLKWIDWLVGDAVAGDTLVFFFSGHGSRNDPSNPGLITADHQLIPQYLLHKRLVSRVPAGCELHIILDCCYAAAMVHLQYRIGRMPKPAGMVWSEPSFVRPMAVSTSPQGPQSPVFSSNSSPAPPPAAFRRTLAGFGDENARLLAPASPDLPAPPDHAVTRTDGSTAIATLPPPSSDGYNHTAGTRTDWARRIASLLNMSETTLSSALPTQLASGDLQRAGKQVVANVYSPDHLEARDEGFIKPAGRVIFWAGAGEDQTAFEALELQVKDGHKIRVNNGIVTHAMCTLLDTRINTKLTVRVLWNNLVGAIDEENRWRRERDAVKSLPPDPKGRIQLAELWVSHPEPLLHAAPVLDRLVF